VPLPIPFEIPQRVGGASAGALLLARPSCTSTVRARDVVQSP
jgi:hypothetical protein